MSRNDSRDDQMRRKFQGGGRDMNVPVAMSLARAEDKVGIEINYAVPLNFKKLENVGMGRMHLLVGG